MQRNSVSAPSANASSSFRFLCTEFPPRLALIPKHSFRHHPRITTAHEYSRCRYYAKLARPDVALSAMESTSSHVGGVGATSPDQPEGWCIVNFYHLVDLPDPREVRE